MKTAIIMTLLSGILSGTSLRSQNQDIISLLNSYYAITHALVNDDGVSAGKSAEEFLHAIDTVSKAAMSSSQLKIWNDNAPKMKLSVEAISKTTDIEKQRSQLNALSVSLFEVVKVFNVGKQSVFYQYCPMKKAYWLSKTKEIRNPYYGKKMLNCGSTKETKK